MPLCTICQINFSRNSNLFAHERKFHSSRQIVVNKEIHTFYTEEEFKTWKYEIEKRTCSKFVQTSGVKKDNSGLEITYFNCHRSGEYQPIQNRKRKLKSSGSLKIGKKCPARMKTVKNMMFGGIEISVTFWPEHEGHAFDPQKLTLSVEEKKIIGSQMAQGITRGRILKNLEKSFSPTNRFSLTSMKDLANISASLAGKSTSLLDKQDADSIDLIVSKLRNESDSPILLYKPQGVLQENLQGFEKDDFLLAIMNDAQLGLLTMYGNAIVQIDSTHGTNVYGIQLTTLTVNDGNQEGFPVAILLSNRETSDTYQVFFSEIKKRLSQDNSTISPVVFMSDDDPTFYSAWESVFGPTSKQLICTWHVERAFNVNLQKKISDPRIREMVSMELNLLHHETDQLTFHNLMKKFLENWLRDKETKYFGIYFKKHFSKRPEQWAHSYWQWLGTDKNMKLGVWHMEVKYGGGEGKVLNSLDKALFSVTHAINRRLFSCTVYIHRPRLMDKISALHNRHNQSIELTSLGISELKPGKTWTVPSSKNSGSYFETYRVQKESDICNQSCDVRCTVCNVCIHQYTCNCIDNMIRVQMCKHIHKVCTLFSHKEMSDDEVGDLEMTNDTDTMLEPGSPEIEIASKELLKQADPSLEKEKNSCIAVLREAIEKIKRITSPQQLALTQTAIVKFISDFDCCVSEDTLSTRIIEPKT